MKVYIGDIHYECDDTTSRAQALRFIDDHQHEFIPVQGPDSFYNQPLQQWWHYQPIGSCYFFCRRIKR